MTHTTYEEMMSLKLDGLLDRPDDLRLQEHLEGCAACGALWAIFQQADSIFKASALEPLPAPTTLHSRVMAQIAAPAQRLSTSAQPPIAASTPLFLPGVATGRLSDMPPFQVPVLPSATPAYALASTPAHAVTRRLPATPTSGLIDLAADWQRRAMGFLRSALAFLLAMAGMLGLLVAVSISGIIPLEGTVGDAVSSIRSLLEAFGSWAGSLVTSSGGALVTVGALLSGLLLLAGWQVVSAYQRSVLESRGQGHTGALTGALHTGPLEVAA